MDIQATTLSVDNIEAKNLKIDGTSFAAKASASTLGGVKINGNNLAIASDGTLSASGGNMSNVPKIWITMTDTVEVDSTIKTGDIIVGGDVTSNSITKIHMAGVGTWGGDGFYGGIVADCLINPATSYYNGFFIATGTSYLDFAGGPIPD